MTTIHQIENEEFERGYCVSDRFAGFDRGDIGRDEQQDEATVIGRMTMESGQRVIVQVWSGPASEGSAEVLVDGRCVFADFDEARARVVGRWWLAGCPA
jgi:hypothetical protein